MTGLDQLHAYAEENRIHIFFMRLGFNPAVTIKYLDNIDFDVALDPTQVSGEYAEKVALMHELAHIATGAFYSDFHDLNYRRKMEKLAQRWLIKFLIPYEKLSAAIKEGYHEIWELAEYFEVPPDFMAEAVEYYQKRKPIIFEQF